MSRRRQPRVVPNWLPREPDLNPWIDQNFRRLSAPYVGENVDNERVAEIGVAEDEAAYEATQRDGCCGFFDIEVKHRASGRRFRFGFNMGH